MKIAITKVYEVDTTFLGFLFHNIDEMPDNLSDFEESLSEVLSNYVEDYEYYENIEELYRKVKSILK
jgi:hypothetical protein